MKVLAVAFSFLYTFSLLAQGISYQSTPHLITDLKKLGQVASQGPNLEFFGHDELKSPEDLVDCEEKTPAQVLKFFKSMVHVINEGSFTEEVKVHPQSYEELASVLGDTSYNFCAIKTFVQYSVSYEIFMTAMDGSYALMFELGYEDGMVDSDEVFLFGKLI